MKILCLFVRHGTVSYPNALAELDRWYSRHDLVESRTLWILDNALDPKAEPTVIAPGVVLRPGDNQAWEFSAWERALREAEAEQIECDVVHFVTSAFNTLYTGYLDHFHPGMLDYVVARKACLGHLDSNPAAVRPGESGPNTWVRTCFFFLPLAVARRLSPWVAFRDPAELFGSPESRDFRPEAPLSVGYRAHLNRWLSGREIGGYQWHSPINFGTGENRRFQGKALAIVNEHGLARTLRGLGYELIDFRWLFSQGVDGGTAVANPSPHPEQPEIGR